MSKLYIIPTPIGNLEDITYRAVKIMKEVDVLLAEDTRQTKKLLDHYGIQRALKAFHQHNEHRITQSIAGQVAAGQSVGLVSDAGTPGISDPGFLLVRACIEAGVEVECLPGATAFVPALVNSGFPMDKFCFEGFLPHKKGRQKRLKELADEERTIIFYESPHRLVKALQQFMEHFGENRQASVSRELTKVYEETKRGSLKALYDYFNAQKVKGEFVIVIKGMDKRVRQ